MISVGSGPGALEFEAGRVMCVDPDPPADCCVAPVAATVADLLRDRPELPDDCTLLLCWCLPNASTYDMEAVELLRPRAVLSLVERFCSSNGAAGGKAFHRRMVDQPWAEGYRIVHRTTVEGETSASFQWIWWERADAKEPDHNLPTVVRGHGAPGGMQQLTDSLEECPVQ